MYVKIQSTIYLLFASCLLLSSTSAHSKEGSLLNTKGKSACKIYKAWVDTVISASEMDYDAVAKKLKKLKKRNANKYWAARNEVRNTIAPSFLLPSFEQYVGVSFENLSFKKRKKIDKNLGKCKVGRHDVIRVLFKTSGLSTEYAEWEKSINAYHLSQRVKRVETQYKYSKTLQSKSDTRSLIPVHHRGVKLYEDDELIVHSRKVDGKDTTLGCFYGEEAQYERKDGNFSFNISLKNTAKDTLVSYETLNRIISPKLAAKIRNQYCAKANKNISIYYYVDGFPLTEKRATLHDNAAYSYPVLKTKNSHSKEYPLYIFKYRIFMGSLRKGNLISEENLRLSGTSVPTKNGWISHRLFKKYNTRHPYRSLDEYLDFTFAEHQAMQDESKQVMRNRRKRTEQQEIARQERTQLLQQNLDQASKVYKVQFASPVFSSILLGNKASVKAVVETAVDTVVYNPDGDNGLQVYLFKMFGGGKVYDSPDEVNNRLLRAYYKTYHLACGKKTAGKPKFRKVDYASRLPGPGPGPNHFNNLWSSAGFYVSEEMYRFTVTIGTTRYSYDKDEWGGKSDYYYDEPEEYPLDEYVVRDVSSLIKKYGCASQPFKSFEKNYASIARPILIGSLP